MSLSALISVSKTVQKSQGKELEKKYFTFRWQNFQERFRTWRVFELLTNFFYQLHPKICITMCKKLNRTRQDDDCLGMAGGGGGGTGCVKEGIMH